MLRAAQKQINRALLLCVAISVMGCDLSRFRADGFGNIFQQGDARHRHAESDIAFVRNETRNRPQDPDAFKRLGSLYLERGNYIQAGSVYYEALLLQPGNRDALLGISHAMAGQGRFSEAYQYATEIGAPTSTPEVQNALGVALAGLGDCQGAQQNFIHILQGNPRDLDARTNLAICQAILGDPDGYTTMRAVAYAPDAKTNHIHNLILVGRLLGTAKASQDDVTFFKLSPSTVREIHQEADAIRQSGKWTLGLALDPDKNA